MRPAWVEIDLAQLRENFRLINQDKQPQLQILSVVKNNAYGHGAVEVAGAAIASGVWGLAVVTIDEAISLRERDIRAPILLLGERMPEELPACLHYDLIPCINEAKKAVMYAELALKAGRRAPIHVEVDTGMSRYGVRWEKALPLLLELFKLENLTVAGIMSHFAMSDEKDKSFALLQLSRFNSVLQRIENAGLPMPLRHMCNSGGYLDLPRAHFDMVRLGILPLGVYPSAVCRRIPGIRPVMAVKTRIVAIQHLQPGDCVGYGMRYQARRAHPIAVLPIGYGDGFPRVRNTGSVLIRGRRAPIVGGNAMDATMVDITEIPEAGVGDEAVLMGSQGKEQISAHEIASWKSSVSYDILVGWRSRLPRRFLDERRSE